MEMVLAAQVSRICWLKAEIEGLQDRGSGKGDGYLKFRVWGL